MEDEFFPGEEVDSFTLPSTSSLMDIDIDTPHCSSSALDLEGLDNLEDVFTAEANFDNDNNNSFNYNNTNDPQEQEQNDQQVGGSFYPQSPDYGPISPSATEPFPMNNSNSISNPLPLPYSPVEVPINATNGHEDFAVNNIDNDNQTDVYFDYLNTMEQPQPPSTIISDVAQNVNASFVQPYYSSTNVDCMENVSNSNPNAIIANEQQYQQQPVMGGYAGGFIQAPLSPPPLTIHQQQLAQLQVDKMHSNIVDKQQIEVIDLSSSDEEDDDDRNYDCGQANLVVDENPNAIKQEEFNLGDETTNDVSVIEANNHLDQQQQQQPIVENDDALKETDQMCCSNEEALNLSTVGDSDKDNSFSSQSTTVTIDDETFVLGNCARDLPSSSNSALVLWVPKKVIKQSQVQSEIEKAKNVLTPPIMDIPAGSSSSSSSDSSSEPVVFVGQKVMKDFTSAEVVEESQLEDNTSNDDVLMNSASNNRKRSRKQVLTSRNDENIEEEEDQEDDQVIKKLRKSIDTKETEATKTTTKTAEGTKRNKKTTKTKVTSPATTPTSNNTTNTTAGEKRSIRARVKCPLHQCQCILSSTEARDRHLLDKHRCPFKDVFTCILCRMAVTKAERGEHLQRKHQITLDEYNKITGPSTSGSQSSSSSSSRRSPKKPIEPSSRVLRNSKGTGAVAETKASPSPRSRRRSGQQNNKSVPKKAQTKPRCDTCDTEFSSAATLSTHMRYFHSTTNLLTCLECSKTFRFPSGLHGHIRGLHGLSHTEYKRRHAPSPPRARVQPAAGQQQQARPEFECLACSVDEREMFASELELEDHLVSQHRVGIIRYRTQYQLTLNKLVPTTTTPVVAVKGRSAGRPRKIPLQLSSPPPPPSESVPPQEREQQISSTATTATIVSASTGHSSESLDNRDKVKQSAAAAIAADAPSTTSDGAEVMSAAASESAFDTTGHDNGYVSRSSGAAELVIAEEDETEQVNNSSSIAPNVESNQELLIPAAAVDC